MFLQAVEHSLLRDFDFISRVIVLLVHFFTYFIELLPYFFAHFLQKGHHLVHWTVPQTNDYDDVSRIP
jgi:hypothetical protein